MTTHGSIGSSTMSTFDPENEAIVSTRQLDQDYIIDNSALRRAFPELSTGSTRSDISVEIGRGYQYQKVLGQVDDSRNRELSYKENVDPIAVIKRQDSHRRRHERPALGTSNSHGSRFSPPKNQHRPNEPEITSSQQPTTTSILLKTLNAARKGSSTKHVAPTRPQATNHDPTGNLESTFIIPEMTTISEVVTGTLHFNSRVDRVSQTLQVQNHLPLVTVPVPYDQQAMFATLKLLQEKVAGLEEGQAHMRRTIEDLRSECFTLKQELKSRDTRPTMAGPTAAKIDADEEGVFDISMPRIPRQKSQELKAKPQEVKVPFLAQEKRVEYVGPEIEVLRETLKQNGSENIIRREISVPAPSHTDLEKKGFGLEVMLKFQGLSLG